MTPARGDGNKENGGGAVLGTSTRGNLPPAAAPSALKAEAAAAAAGRAPVPLAAEDSYDTAGCARHAGAAAASGCWRAQRGGARQMQRIRRVRAVRRSRAWLQRHCRFRQLG
jgi:hypothetical protein